MTHADTGNDYPLGKPWQTSPPVKASGAMVAEDNMASIADMQPEDEAELEKMVLVSSSGLPVTSALSDRHRASM